MKNPAVTMLAVLAQHHLEGKNRLRGALIPILQGSIASGVSFWVATTWFGHHKVFFAPMAAIIIIGFAGGDRLRKAVELNIGVTLGVGLGDFLVSRLGGGAWQMTIMVAIALIIAIYADRSPIVFTQAGLGVVLIATIFPPGTSGGIDRMLDSFIGGTVGLIIIALLPQRPLKGARVEIGTILRISGAVLTEVSQALPHSDSARIKRALQAARGTQGNINNLIAQANAGKEAVTLSPLQWRNKKRMNSLGRILNPVDNAMRNTRVLARRALTLTQDADHVSAEQLAIIAELGEVTTKLSTLFASNKKIPTSADLPEIVAHLRRLGGRCGMNVADGSVLSAMVVLGQSRSIIVDLLQVCGMSKRSALAVLQPTSSHPAVEPEIWREHPDQRPH